MSSNLLSEREKAAVLWAEHVTKKTLLGLGMMFFERVRSIFDEQEIVELTMICGLLILETATWIPTHPP